MIALISSYYRGIFVAKITVYGSGALYVSENDSTSYSCKLHLFTEITGTHFQN